MAGTVNMTANALPAAGRGTRSVLSSARAFGCTSALRGTPLAGSVRLGRRDRSGAVTTKAVGWDPEGILRPPEPGHINRRQYFKKVASDQAFLEQEEKRLQKEIEERDAKRNARVIPDIADHKGSMKFLLETDTDEVDFELVRLRPNLTPEFVKYLEGQIAAERISPRRDEGRLTEWQGLLKLVQEGVAKVDNDAKQLAAPADRLKKLLSSPKKETILEMAGENEIDSSLILLLEQNIAGARGAGQEDAAVFMEKVKAACTKYVLK